jgi:hypothetical protein
MRCRFADNETARQAARSWSGRLGNLAGELPKIRPEAALAQLDTTSAPTLPARLSWILKRLRQHNRIRDHAADKLRAQEFLAGP